MKLLIEQLIADFHERALPELTVRSEPLPALAGKIDAVIGMRRTGKTSFLYQVMQEYLDRGVEKEAMIYINFDDERLLPMDVSQLSLIDETYFRLFPQRRESRCYFFFDEIQNISGWEHYLRRLVDTEDIQIVVTGSSAKLLSREIATALRGRSISTEIFPFSFNESLNHQGIAHNPQKRAGAKERALLENRMRSYLLSGGFPEVQGLADDYRIRILQEYVDVVILRDVIERHQVSNVHALRSLIRHLLSSTATLFSINKFYNDLKSQGIACGKTTLYEYLEHLMDAYLVFAVPVHTLSERVRRSNPRKIYSIDSGLSNAFLPNMHADRGRLLENAVFIALRRKQLTVEYYRSKAGFEVDFITTARDGSKQLIQVTLSISDQATRERELRAITAAMKETGLQEGFIITLEEEEEIPLDEGMIQVRPAWQWMATQ